MLIIFLLLITYYLYWLKNKKANESFINEYGKYCGTIDNSKKCNNNNSSCIWTTLSGQTVANGNTQSYSFCDVKNHS
jgi:putative N-acetylmannosamine-6-phosphate epimerase